MNFYLLMAKIISSADAISLVKNVNDIELEDTIRLEIIEMQIKTIAKKYNPEWFEEIED